MKLFSKRCVSILCISGALGGFYFLKGSASPEEYFFRVGPKPGDRKVIQLTIKEPSRIQATANWTQENVKLALILNGPGQTGFYARKDGYPPLSLEFEVTPDLANKGSGWSVSVTNMNQAKIASGKLNISVSKKLPPLASFPSVRMEAQKVVGVRGDFSEIPISKLKAKVAANFGKKEIPKNIRARGYFYHDRVPLIISDPELLKVDSPLPEDSYVVLKGKVPPRSSIGQMVEVSGNVQQVEEKVFLSSLDYSFTTRTPAFAFKVEKLEMAKRIASLLPKKYAVLISGGVNEENNHSRYWNNLKYISNVLKFDYGFSDENTYVLYYDGTAEDDSVSVDYACTKANIQQVFNELRNKTKKTDLLFLYTTNHGGGYKRRGAPGSRVGYCSGRIVFTGNEGNEVREDNFIIDGHYSDGTTLAEGEGFWLDFDGDGIRDDVLLNKDGDLVMYVNGDPDADGFIENDDVDGKDTDGDFIIDSSDGGVDLNDDGDKNDWVGIDEVLNLLGREKLYDDELQQMLQGLQYRTMIVAMGQCFSGGFIDDLAGDDRIIIASASPWEYAWATDDLNYSEFIYLLSYGLNKMAFPIFREGKLKPLTLFPGDANADKKISLVEAFNFALSKVTQPSTPLYEDDGALPSRSGPMPQGNEGKLGQKTFLD